MVRKENEYLSSWEKAVHLTNAKLSLEQEEEVLKAFQAAGEDLIAKLVKSKNGYLPLRIYKDYAYDLYTVLDQLVSEYSNKAVQNVIDAQVTQMLNLLGEGGQNTAKDFGTTFRHASKVYSKQAAEAVVKGEIYKDNKGLSKRIWSISSKASTTVHEVITKSVASGMSAVDTAKLLEQFIRPEARKTWDYDRVKETLGPVTAKKYSNLEYNALRLARTTISHSATAGVRQWSKINPYAKKIQWHSVHAPGRTCQTCIDLDGEIFTAEDCPFDHPNGMCYQTVWYDKSLEEIADELRDWVNGDSNDMLDSWYSDLLDEDTNSYRNPRFIKTE